MKNTSCTSDIQVHNELQTTCGLRDILNYRTIKMAGNGFLSNLQKPAFLQLIHFRKFIDLDS